MHVADSDFDYENTFTTSIDRNKEIFLSESLQVLDGRRVSGAGVEGQGQSSLLHATPSVPVGQRQLQYEVDTKKA